MKHNLILRVVSKFLIPLIFLFALYVQFHGDFGPGGGFQAGVIFSAAIILYALVFGVDDAKKVIPPHILRVLASLGVLFMPVQALPHYCLVGTILSMACSLQLKLQASI